MPIQDSLPTFDRLGGCPPVETDPIDVAERWLLGLSEAIGRTDVDVIVERFLGGGYWRDMLALTWSFRTFHGRPAITRFLQDRLANAHVANLRLSQSDPPSLVHPFYDIAWIQSSFLFEVAAGTASGIFRLVYVPSDATWKCYMLYTNLESIGSTLETVGPRRNFYPNHGLWLAQRQRDTAFEGEEPTVVIIGAGQGGLAVGARLKHLGIRTLIIEKNARVGDQWRQRYEALCLHDPVWYDHMPYLPFPSSWPVYTPAAKLADWLESYAHHLELDVWASTTITAVKWNADRKSWTVEVIKADSGKRIFHDVRHVVYACGYDGGMPNIPKFSGMEDFQGTLMHTYSYKTARDYVSKHVVVIGAATAGHDVAQDLVNHGVDVTMYQRGSTYVMSTRNAMPIVMQDAYCEDGPPTELADRRGAAIPIPVMKLLHQRLTAQIAELDKDILDGLDRVGFRTNMGVEGSGNLYLAYTKGGGYYLEVGASQLIIDGKIKLKNDSHIQSLTAGGIKFEDGSELPADVIILATGFGDLKDSVRRIFEDEVVDTLKPTWGLDDEGEIRGAWRYSGHDRFWFMMGNLALCRFHSKHIALQIQAMERGIPVTRYDIETCS